MSAPPKVDYGRIEPDWRAGIKTPAQLAAEYTAATETAVTQQAIIKHFKKRGVPRDLAAKVHAKAEAMVQASMVQAKVQTGTISESEIVDVSAAAEARIRIAHRSDIGRARTLAISLLAELEAQTGGLTDFQSLGEMLRAPDDNNRDRLNDAYQAVIALPERTKTMKALAETLKVLVGLEREAYSIAPLAPDEPPPGKPPDISDPGAYYRWLSAQGAKA